MDRTVSGKLPRECCGCGACVVACPKKAITMEEDQYGCVYPVVDMEKCIHCSACLRACGYGDLAVSRVPREAWAAVGKESLLVDASASGGVFATLAKNLMESGGLAAGAVLSREKEGFRAEHILSGDLRDISRIQGSKYVHSQAWHCYAQVLEALASGKKVFFSGTPCQVAAIKRLTGDPDNLITLDLVCHGVPPLRMFNEFCRGLAGRLGGDMDDFVFRDKSCGKNFCARVAIRSGGRSACHYLSAGQLSFYRYFLEGSIYRENCYSCPYAGLIRISDLTAGDFWGIENHHGEDISQGRMPKRKDWSLVLVNTEKGTDFLSTYGRRLSLYPSRPEWAAEENGQLKAPSRKHENRERILEQYASGGYRKLETAFIKESGGALRFYWRMLKNMLRNRRLHRMNKDAAYED